MYILPLGNLQVGAQRIPSKRFAGTSPSRVDRYDYLPSDIFDAAGGSRLGETLGTGNGAGVVAAAGTTSEGAVWSLTAVGTKALTGSSR